MMTTAVNPADRRAGTTLVEVVVSATILVMMMGIASTLTRSGTNAQRYSERASRVTELTRGMIDSMRRDLTASVRLFVNDADGRGYLSLMTLSPAAPALAARLPELNETGIFDPDTLSTTRTGNTLAFARHAWRTKFTVTSGATYRIDVYRIVRYYLVPVRGGPSAREVGGLDLARWVSEPLADGGEIDRIPAGADRDEVCTHLLTRSPDDDGRTHPAVMVVWHRNQGPTETDTFRQIVTSGSLSSTPVSPRPNTWSLLRDPARSADSLLAYRHHAVASVWAAPGWGVGRFGQISTGGAGFPHGFETQIIGPASARQVLLRLVLAGTRDDSMVAWSSNQTVVDARDL